MLGSFTIRPILPSLCRCAVFYGREREAGAVQLVKFLLSWHKFSGQSRGGQVYLCVLNQ